MNATFFATQAALRRWLQTHHRTERELWVGFYKKSTRRPTITYREALDEALCAGWIDGIRKSIDEYSYTNRFTPRRPGSYWSAINIRRAKELIREGRMFPSGKAAFAVRSREKPGKYSYERRRDMRLGGALATRFRKNGAAWKFFQTLPPGARQLWVFHIMSAKQDVTRERRLERVIAACAAGRRPDPMGPVK